MRGCCRRCLRVPSCLGDRAVDVSVDRRCLRHRKWASARVLDCRMSLEPYSNAEWNAEIRSRIGSRTAELWRFERASYFVAALGAEPEVVARCGLALWIDEKKIFPMSCLSTSWDRKCGVWSVGKIVGIQYCRGCKILHTKWRTVASFRRLEAPDLLRMFLSRDITNVDKTL